MKKITKLTPEQEARFPEFFRKWTTIGLSTAPADRPRAEKAIAGLYKLARLKKPRIIWLPCPISAALSAVCYAKIIQHRLVNPQNSAVRSAVRSAVDSAVRSAVRSAVGVAVDSAVDSAVRSAVYSAVRSAVDSAVRSAVDSAVGVAVYSAVGVAVYSAVDSTIDSAVDSAVGNAGQSYYGGSMGNSGYSSWVDYFNTVCGIAIDRNFLEMTESCGFYWVLDGICFASERPSEINRDDEGRLHSETGMSIRYAGSGWGLFHWHGTAVPGEILGWANVLRSLKAETIDKDDDPEIGNLVAVKLPNLRDKAKFLLVRCGTGRDFAIGVPPHINKAIDAQAWIVGLEPKDFIRPEIRA